MDNFQREGAESNTQVGLDFEDMAKEYIEAKLKTSLETDYKVFVGLSTHYPRKERKFDLGNKDILVECKSHSWTRGNNVPSAKMTIWNEAMYYFSLTPKNIRKILFVKKDVRERDSLSLAKYYCKTKGNLIPDEVEIWEFDEEQKKHEIVTPTVR